MRGQVAGAVAIEKSRSVIHVHRGPGTARKSHAHAGTDGVALIVVEEKVAFFGRREIRQTAGDSAGTLGVLMGVGEMELGATGDAWRAGGGFPTADASAVDGQREEDVGVAEDVVVEEIVGCGAEVGNVEGPACEGNGESELALFITLAVQRQEAAVGVVTLR